MKVSNIQAINAVNAYRNKQEQAAELKKTNKKLKDEVEISSEAKQLHGAQKSEATPIQAGASVEKLEALKQDISTGIYHVDANKIAEKLLPYL